MHRTRLTTRLRSFRRNASGATAIAFALLLVVLCAGAGMAVDFGSAIMMRTRLQGALDAALLAGARAYLARAGSEVDVIPATMESNWGEAGGLTPTVTYTLDSSGTLRGVARVDIPATFTRVIGYESIPVEVQTDLTFGLGKLDLALVLDSTGSMMGSKLSGAQSAAKGLIDQIYSVSGADTKVRVGLVPFGQYVNVGLQYRREPWMQVPDDYTQTGETCGTVTPIISSSNCRTVSGTCTNDGLPYTCSWTECDNVYGPPVYQCTPTTTTYTWSGCVGSRNSPLDVTVTADSSNRVPGIMNTACPSPLARLTADQRAIKSQIDAMVATGDTYIPAGLLWGWRVLSAGAPFSDGTTSGGTRRAMVLMTDGANTRSATYPGHDGTNVSTANTTTETLCARIKASGVEIYTIAFDVTDRTVIDLMTRCASSTAHYYTAATVSDLHAAFDGIGRSLTAIRLSK
ncbi:MAG: VWA domain-containing protein [Hyphomicrobiaceae bacterium]|nr:VWA domain-containing protein [Hyphomicrobiaceae bacterium]